MTVMEIANGEYGDMVNKLVVAVLQGKCQSWNQNSSTSFIPAITDETKTHLTCPAENSESLTHVTVNIGATACENGSHATDSLLDSDDHLPSRCSSFPTSCWVQFMILLRRTFICIIRDQVFLNCYPFFIDQISTKTDHLDDV